MPDLKISQLPVASTPLAGTELVPIVQGGVTDQTTVGAIMTSTVPSGTANGVLYLNGSKVATSGSELTFTGATFANNGLTSVTSLQAVTSTNTAQLQSRPDISYSRVTSSSFLLDLATLSNQPILFTVNSNEQMRLDSSGNLGLGVTPSAWSSTVKAMQIGPRLGIYDTGSTGAFVYNAYINSAGNPIYLQTAAATIYDTSAGLHRWYTAPSGTAGNPITGANAFVQTMTLDASGNLLVGAIATVASERLRVTGSGSTNATYITYFENSSATRCFAIESAGRIYTGTAADSPYNFTTASAANLFVASDGTLYRSTSSLKYKTDVQDATHGLAEVMQLRPVTYKGKKNGDTVFGGLIAEEVHAAGLTEFVQYAPDGSPDALAYGNMVALLTKAIQEQQALIAALTARVAALESQP